MEKAVQQDIDLTIAYLSSQNEQEDFIHNGVEYHSINPYHSKNYLIFRLKRFFMGWSAQDRKTLSRLQEIVALTNPELIHIHGSEYCFGLIGQGKGCVSIEGRSIPIAISLQGIIKIYFERFFSGIPAKEVKRYESIGCKLRKQSTFRAYRRMRHQSENEHIILSGTKYVFGRTEFDRAEASKANPEVKYFTVGEIMREPFYQKLPANKPAGGKFRIASTLSGGIYKGYEMLLKVAAILKKSAADFEWIVIGYSSKDEAVRIGEKYTRLDSSFLGVKFMGIQDAQALVSILDSSNLYCHVSHIENSPNSVCEAMLRGLPVVAANVGGIESIVNDNVTGLLYPDSDAAACADAIVSLLRDTQRAAAMGENGREIALQRHSPEKVRTQLLSAYREILSIRN